MTRPHKTDPHARGRPKNQRPRAPKEEAISDTELQRYVMPSERVSPCPRKKQGASETQRRV